jgi:EAL domain-containing protein (putative c-di-GMP-specific phosphodiesterase class I)/DNA-binding NarL/FixJ family response regulator
MNHSSTYQRERASTLLLVDDEPAILRSLSRAFKQSPYEVLLASSAEQAQDIMANNNVQVLLSDYRMPDTDGGELLRQVKQEYPETISMILSGYADFTSVQEVINSGTAFRFLSKPWNNNELLKHVEQAFCEYEKGIEGQRTHQKQPFYSSAPLEPDTILADSLMHVIRAEIGTLLKASEDFYVIQVHIDNFHHLKSLCDIHLAELLLCQLSAYADELLSRDSVCLYAGGGCFYFICKKNDLNDHIEPAMSALYQKLIMPFYTVDESFKVCCKLAYLDVSDDKHTPSSIISNLSAVLNDSRFVQDNWVQLDNEQLEKLRRDRKITYDIQPAIEQEAFELYFQPKVSLPHRKIESAEILMRWKHSELGWISPEEFIRLSELDGQIDNIWQWLSKASFAAIKSLTEKHPDLKRLSLNISSRQLQSSTVVEELQGLLHENQLSAEHIELEITETNVLSNIEKCSDTVLALKRLGFQLSIDDFGSGYSSLAYIAKLPIDVVKLDKSLIDDLSHSEANRSLVRHILQMTYALGIKTVVEGVESHEQLEILEQMPCDSIQGFLFSPAVDFNAFHALCLEQPFRK